MKKPTPLSKEDNYSQGMPDKILDSKKGTTRFIKAICDGDITRVKTLLKYGADVDLADKKGQTPLYHAVSRGKKQITDILIGVGANVNLANEKGETPLFEAVKREKGMVDALLSAGAFVDVENDEKQTVLHVAAKYASEEIVSDIFEQTKNVNCPDKEGVTPLHIAARFNSLSVLKVMLFGQEVDLKAVDKQGGHVMHYALDNAKEKNNISHLLSTEAVLLLNVSEHTNGKTPLHVAIERKDKPLVRKMVGLGADIHAVDRQRRLPIVMAIGTEDLTMMRFLMSLGAELEAGETKSAKKRQPFNPLMMAVSKGSEEIVDFLLEYGVDVNIRNDMGQTPILEAASRGHSNIARKLLEAKADLSIVDNNDRNILHHVRFNFDDDLLKEILKDKKVNLNQKDQYGITPLMSMVPRYQMAAGSSQRVIIMVEAGADVEGIDHLGLTVLHVAVEYGNIDLVKALIRKKADMNAETYSGIFPIHLTIINDDADMLKLLLDAGASADTEDALGFMPIDVAVMYGDEKVVEVLLNAGATVSLKVPNGLSTYDLALTRGGRILEMVKHRVNEQRKEHIDQKNNKNANGNIKKPKP